MRITTVLDGEVSQRIEYVPLGEVFIEERNNTWNTPYLFNAKELDEEMGMYYEGHQVEKYAGHEFHETRVGNGIEEVACQMFLDEKEVIVLEVAE